MYLPLPVCFLQAFAFLFQSQSFIDLNKEIYNGEEMIGKNTKNKEHKLQIIYKDKSYLLS
jgi:hypothetical protein